MTDEKTISIFEFETLTERKYADFFMTLEDRIRPCPATLVSGSPY